MREVGELVERGRVILNVIERLGKRENGEFIVYNVRY